MLSFKVKKGTEESLQVKRIELGSGLPYSHDMDLVVWTDDKGKLRKDYVAEVRLFVFVMGKFMEL